MRTMAVYGSIEALREAFVDGTIPATALTSGTVLVDGIRYATSSCSYTEAGVPSVVLTGESGDTISLSWKAVGAAFVPDSVSAESIAPPSEPLVCELQEHWVMLGGTRVPVKIDSSVDAATLRVPAFAIHPITESEGVGRSVSTLSFGAMDTLLHESIFVYHEGETVVLPLLFVESLGNLPLRNVAITLQTDTCPLLTIPASYVPHS